MTPTPNASISNLTFFSVVDLFNGEAGLREFFLSITAEDVTEETRVDFIVSTSKTPVDWATVKDHPAKYSHVFVKDVPREIYFSTTDKYNEKEQPNQVVDFTTGATAPADFMKPGETYYVHVYSSEKFVSSSKPITLQNYPDNSQLPKQITATKPVWAADEKPGKT